MKRSGVHQGTIRAGAAQVEITPWADVQVAGSGAGERRRAQAVIDPIYAKALVVAGPQGKICLVSADLTIITKIYADRIRAAAAKRLGCARDAVMVHATQTHSAPSLGHFLLAEDLPGLKSPANWLGGGCDEYGDYAVEKIIQAIGNADAALQPVHMAEGKAIEGRLAFNRRAVGEDGKVFMPPRFQPKPLGLTRMAYLEGPIDPEVGVVVFRRDDLHIPAMLLHYTCHPVHVFPKELISADWPGAWCRGMANVFGQECVPLVVNGCCGDINPWDPFDPDYPDDHERMGAMLADRASDVIETLRFRPASEISCASMTLELPMKEIERGPVEEARRLLAETPGVLWTDETRTLADPRWFRAAQLVTLDRLRSRSPVIEYEIQVFRVGDIAVVGLPGEPFVEGQLRIKLASPARRTLVAHCVNQYVGYIPTREAFPRGGHEVDTSTWAKVTPDALDAIVEGAVALLGKLFEGQPAPSSV